MQQRRIGNMATLIAAMGVGTWAEAQTAVQYPTRPVRFIVPYLPGGTTAIGFDIRTSTPEEFARFIKEDMARMAKVIKSSGIKAE